MIPCSLKTVLLASLFATSVLAQRSAVERCIATLKKNPTIESGFMVARARDGRVLGAYRDEVPMIPASNMKILTAGAALLALGPDHEILTDLVAQGDVTNGVLEGSLRLRGEGDPTLSSRGQGNVIDLLVEAVKRAGIKRVTGDLLVDDRAFSGDRIGPSWPTGNPTASWMAECSALSLDHGCVSVQVQGGSGDGARVSVAILPRGSGISVRNTARTTTDITRHSVDIQRGEEGQIVVRGRVLLGRGPQAFDIAAEDPAMVFGNALADALTRNGVAVAGRARRPLGDEALRGGTLLSRNRTKVRDIIGVLLEVSQNHRADMLARHLSAALADEGSFEGVSKTLPEVFRQRGVPMEGVVIKDGSGLSRENRLTARSIVAVLRVLYDSEHRERFRGALPAGGEGTLRRRGPLIPLGERVQAKTGTLRGVSALSGYVTPEDGEPLIFSLINNSETNSVSAMRSLQDTIASLLAEG